MSPFLFNSKEDLFAGVLDVTTESLALQGGNGDLQAF